MNAKEMNVIISLCYRTLIKILNNLIDREQRKYYVQTNTFNIFTEEILSWYKRILNK